MRVRLVLMVIAAAGVLAAGEARAQVRFSIGGSGWSVGNAPYGYGGYGYGNGWGGYGYGYSPRNYGPPVNRGYYYEDDDYVQPTYVPQQAVRPNPYAGPGVTVRNPAGTKVNLSYLLDDSQERDIPAGETQKLTTKGSYIVSFDRGGSHGTARYTITEGLYEFTMTDHGWELYRQKEVPPEKQADPKVKSNPLPEEPKKDAPEVEPPKPRDV